MGEALRLQCCRAKCLFGRNSSGGNLGNRYARRGYAENTNRAAHLHGDSVVRRMALHHRLSPPDFLERGFRVGGLAVLSRRALQCAGALISRTPEAKTPLPCLWIKEELGCPVTYAVTREKDSETSSSLSSLSLGSYPLRQRAHLAGSINSPGSSHSAHWLYTTKFVSMADLHRLGTPCKGTTGRRRAQARLVCRGRVMILRRLPARLLCSALLPRMQ